MNKIIILETIVKKNISLFKKPSLNFRYTNNLQVKNKILIQEK